jgi:hypothetical protein
MNFFDDLRPSWKFTPRKPCKLFVMQQKLTLTNQLPCSIMGIIIGMQFWMNEVVSNSVTQ